MHLLLPKFSLRTKKVKLDTNINLFINKIMAKSNTIQVKMVSTADTGFFYVKNRNPKSKSEKLELKKYDPKVRKHVIFKEQKIK